MCITLEITELNYYLYSFFFILQTGNTYFWEARVETWALPVFFGAGFIV